MKKTIIAIILYFLIIHLLLPGIYYLIYGFTPIYSDVIDNAALIKAAFLIAAPFIITIVILLCLPNKHKNGQISPTVNGKPISELFYFSVLLKLVIFYYYGGFASVISGEANGSLANYVTLFFNPFLLLLAVLFVQKKRSNSIIAILFYIISATLSGSRSGILSAVFVFLIGYSFVNFQLYRKGLYRLMMGGLMLAPLVFVYATILRGYTDKIDLSVVFNQIVGRMSVLETSMLPVHFYDNNMNLDLFYDKYSFINQFKLSLDSLIPGQLFDFDVMPNNYYRAIFMGYDQTFVFENYLSINLTLPIYLYLKYSYYSIILTPVYLVGFYKLLQTLKKYPLMAVVLVSVFYNVLYFFDWVFIITQLYKALLTVIFLKSYILFRTEFKMSMVRNKYAH
jgi:hypothetical protein